MTFQKSNTLLCFSGMLSRQVFLVCDSCVSRVERVACFLLCLVIALVTMLALGQVLEKCAGHGHSFGHSVGIITCDDMRETGLDKEEVQV